MLTRSARKASGNGRRTPCGHGQKVWLGLAIDFRNLFEAVNFAYGIVIGQQSPGLHTALPTDLPVLGNPGKIFYLPIAQVNVSVSTICFDGNTGNPNYGLLVQPKFWGQPGPWRYVYRGGFGDGIFSWSLVLGRTIGRKLGRSGQ